MSMLEICNGASAVHAGSRSTRPLVLTLAASAIAVLIAFVALVEQADAAAEVRVEGVIEDGAGDPIHGARIGQGDRIDITGKDGIFALDGIDSKTRLRVFASGYEERYVKVEDRAEPLEIALETRPIKAIYLNPFISTTEADIDRLIELVDTTELNAIVVDIKEQLVFYDTQVALFNDAGTVNPILDLDALYDLLRDDHIAAAGLDVLPQEPPVEPIPKLLAAYRAKEPWLEGRLVVTPHSAWLTPHSWEDTRRKSAETMRAALLTNKPQNVITPEMY